MINLVFKIRFQFVQMDVFWMLLKLYEIFLYSSWLFPQWLLH